MLDRRLLTVLVLVAGCHAREAPSSPPSAAAPAPPAPPSPPRDAKLAALPTGLRAKESAGAAVARLDDRVVAFVADEDDHAIHTVDATTLEPIARTDLGTQPRDVLVLERGVVLVTLPRANAIAVLEPKGMTGELRVERRIPTSTEPLAMAISADGTKIAITAGAGHRIDFFAAESLTSTSTREVPREPRATMFAANGNALFVTHATQSALTKLALDDAPASSIELGISQSSFDSTGADPSRSARHANALVRVGDKIVVPVVQNAPRHGAPPGGYGGGQELSTWMMAPPPMDVDIDSDGQRHFRPRKPKPRVDPPGPPNRMSAFDLRSIDEATAKPTDLPARDFARTPTVPKLLGECLLPRAAVATDARVLVACSGDSQVIALDPTSPWPRVVARYETGRGPSAIARVDAASAVVWAPLARKLSRIPTASSDDIAETASRDLPRTIPVDERILAGHELFTRNGDKRISKDGLACATCHPDGRDDGLVWQTPLGDRRPRTLAGNVDRDTPFGWGAEQRTIQGHVKGTLKRLRGEGLPDEQLESLFAYLRSLPPVPLADRPSDPEALRGAEVFASDRAACATCHEPENGFTDNRHHYLGYGGMPSVTPSLLGVGARARLFHDGRYVSFEEMLVAQAPEYADYFTPMGGVRRLSVDERRDLIAYLRTL